MNRRRWLVQTGIGLATLKRAYAQPAHISRVAYVAPSAGPTPITEAFRKMLAELGYREGNNLVIEYRWMAGRESDYPATLNALEGKVDVALVYGDVSVAAARPLARHTPIVFVNTHDPVALGLVESLSRPGGNMTGISNAESELIGKRLELLSQAAPRVSHFGVLVDPHSTASSFNVAQVETVARALGLIVRRVDLARPADIQATAAQIARQGLGGIVVAEEPWFFAHRADLVAQLARHRLPSAYPFRQFVEVGGLLSYSADLIDLAARGAGYVAKILGGRKPASLPVERPTKFELVVSLRTAKILGLSIPQSILLRADKVFE